jgi:hypothetical protein
MGTKIQISSEDEPVRAIQFQNDGGLLQSLYLMQLLQQLLERAYNTNVRYVGM